jgi:hypothetical protein
VHKIEQLNPTITTLTPDLSYIKMDRK